LRGFTKVKALLDQLEDDPLMMTGFKNE